MMLPHLLGHQSEFCCLLFVVVMLRNSSFFFFKVTAVFQVFLWPGYTDFMNTQTCFLVISAEFHVGASEVWESLTSIEHR